MKNAPDRLNQVTTLSKVLAAVIFISLPFLGFFIGFRYQSEMSDMACWQPQVTPMTDKMPADTKAPATNKPATTTPAVKY